MKWGNQGIILRRNGGRTAAQERGQPYPRVAGNKLSWTQSSALLFGLVLLGCFALATGAFAKPPEPVLLVVMDPLAKELACACVKGYGQRDYRKLAARLEKTIKQPVTIEFSDDLAESLADGGAEREVIVIGEASLVRLGAGRAGLKAQAVAELTGLDGGTTVTGLFVARKDDPARELRDIAGRKVLLGLAEGDSKLAAAQAALRNAKLTPLAATESRSSGNEAALDVLDSSDSPLPVAVIPSFALPLLEGCGSIKPGDLRVIGKTEPVAFITVFMSDRIATEKREQLLKSLLGLKSDAKLLQEMESRDGFKVLKAAEPAKPQAGEMERGIHAASTSKLERGHGETGTPAEMTTAKRAEARAPDWPDWRGPARDGLVPRLPTRLPTTAKFVWKKAAMTGGLAGLSVSDGRLILAERDFGDEHDVYRCLNSDDGELLWRVEFPARGTLDYGQFPRATPVIHGGRAYLLGAFGELRCVDVADGKVLWRRHLIREFDAELPTWGMSATPLVVDDLLIVNPGGKNAALAALDLATGQSRWTTPGQPAAYASFICGEFGGRRQIVGYDQFSLGGWDAKTGERLWQLVPPTEGDFNVPTPIAVDGGLIVSTENNGTRLYCFDDAGRIIPKPAAEFADLSPDTATPVVTGGRLFGAHLGLRCLDVRNGLKPVWHWDDGKLGDYATLIADAERVLGLSVHGELLLLDAKASECVILSRLKVFEDDVEVYSHPALVGARLYVRGGSSVVCLDLSAVELGGVALNHETHETTRE
jgi:outer membrane protein assembly factor BamB